MRPWLGSALLALALMTGTGVLGTAATARAQVQEGEPQPQNRAFYLRALGGGVYYHRLTSLSEDAFGFVYGGELGFKLFTVRAGEFDSIGLGVHYDQMSVSSEQVDSTQTLILGQVTFLKSTDVGGYFGVQAGVRQVTNNDLEAGSGFVAGLMGGVEIPLTTHLTYGPQLDVLYAFDTPFSLNGIDSMESNLIGRFYLAVTWHF